MRDDQHRHGQLTTTAISSSNPTFPHQIQHTPPDQLGALAIERRRRLIEDQEAWQATQRARNHHPLGLSAGEAEAAVSDQRVVAPRQGEDEVVDACATGGGVDVGGGG